VAPIGVGSIGDPETQGRSASTPGRAGTPGGSGGSGAPGGSGTSGTSGLSIQAAPLPARVRLMNNTEYNNTVAALLGDTTQPASAFPVAAKQDGFSNNVNQIAGSVLAAAFDTSAQTLAANAAKSLPTLLPCDPVAVGETACASAFITTFGPRAFRRPLTSDDQSGLMGVYTASRQSGADFPKAMEMVLYGILNSASFLYVTELGAGGPSGSTTSLTPYETASSLSYFLVASPPDAQLRTAAATNALGTPDALAAHARRLLADPRAHGQVKRFFQEWFEMGASTKDSTVYPSYQSVSASFLAETPALVDDVIFNGDGTLQSLLLADYTFVDSALAAFYQLPVSVPAGQLMRVSLAGSNRLGLLGNAGFLSSHSDATMSSPIFRGVFVRRRLLCQALPPPPAGLNITPPARAATKTTRQLFDAHTSNPACSGCHTQIDPIGNGLENFDGEGHYRTMDNGQPVDGSGEVANTQDANGKFTGVVELAHLLAQSKQVQSCFARQLFRFGSAQNGDATEQEFFNEMPNPIPASFQDIVVAYVRTAMFTKRVNP
jgi:hypothetical protein